MQNNDDFEKERERKARLALKRQEALEKRDNKKKDRVKKLKIELEKFGALASFNEKENKMLEEAYLSALQPSYKQLNNNFNVNLYHLSYQEALFREVDCDIFNLVKKAFLMRFETKSKFFSISGEKNVAVVCIRHADNSVSMEAAISGEARGEWSNGPPGHSERIALRKAINKAIADKKPEFNGLSAIDELTNLEKPSVFSLYQKALKQCQIDIFSDRGPCDKDYFGGTKIPCNIFFGIVLQELSHRFFCATPYLQDCSEIMTREIESQLSLSNKLQNQKGRALIYSLIQPPQSNATMPAEKKGVLESSSPRNQLYSSTGSSSPFPTPPPSYHILFNLSSSAKSYVNPLEPLIKAIRADDANTVNDLLKELNIKIIDKTIQDAIDQISDLEARAWMQTLVKLAIETNNKSDEKPSL